MAETTNDRVYDLEAAQKWLAEHGMVYNTSQMKRIMHTKKLPFRLGPNGRKKYVPESALLKFVAPAE